MSAGVKGRDSYIDGRQQNFPAVSLLVFFVFLAVSLLSLIFADLLLIPGELLLHRYLSKSNAIDWLDQTICSRPILSKQERNQFKVLHTSWVFTASNK